MGLKFKWKLEEWQVEKFLSNRIVIVSKTKEEAIRILTRYKHSFEHDTETGNLIALREIVELTEIPKHAVVWVESDFKMEEFSTGAVPGWNKFPKSFWFLPKILVLISNDGQVVDLRDMTGYKWREASEYAKVLTTPTEFETVDWTAGGRVHNWRNHVHEYVQQLWTTFNIDQKFALYRQATIEANSEEWD